MAAREVVISGSSPSSTQTAKTSVIIEGGALALPQPAHGLAKATLPHRQHAHVGKAEEEKQQERHGNVVSVGHRDSDRYHEVGGHEDLQERRQRLGGAILLARPGFELA